MTFGQRIAQKRKELGLSQEGLGEQLGVSRQAIYKWESDASLPEIDKLITLSKIFSVPVGWLLGVEESAPERAGQDQEKLVEEVLSRYQAAQPVPRKSVWDKWSVRILFAMCGIMLALLVGTSHKMKELDQRYVNLANSIGEINYSVDRQINSITSRVENILQSQNNLTAEWSAELASTDLTANTATFTVRAVPKTYVEGMSAVFVANSGEDVVEAPIEVGADHAFTGQVTCPLTDQINLSVVFVTDGRRETQWLNDFYGLYSATFPALTVRGRLWAESMDGGILSPSQSRATMVWDMEDSETHSFGFHPDPPASLRVGLFQDRKLVCWYEEEQEDITFDGAPARQYTWNRTGEVTLTPGSVYCEAAVYTDEYGRQRIYPDTFMTYEEPGKFSDSASAEVWLEDGQDPADWEF